MTLAVNQHPTTKAVAPIGRLQRTRHTSSGGQRTSTTTKLTKDFSTECGLYLFRGELIEMASMKNPHAMSITKGTKVLFAAFDPKVFDIRVQTPFDVPGESMPEPDLLVCSIEDGKRQPHPARRILAVEISESSIDHDRDKALEYAAAQINEYWIIDLNDRCIEVYRNPVPDRTAPLGFRYPPPTVVRENETISPLAMPATSVKVIDLLP